MVNCRFCDIVNRKVSDYIIWEDEKFIAFLDSSPANPGHCMLIPKKHFDYFFDMDDELYQELFMTAKKLAEPLRKITNAKRIGIAVLGFSMPHAHLHLIPLHGPDELFDEGKLAKQTHEELQKTQNNLKEALKKI